MQQVRKGGAERVLAVERRRGMRVLCTLNDSYATCSLRVYVEVREQENTCDAPDQNHGKEQ